MAVVQSSRWKSFFRILFFLFAITLLGGWLIYTPEGILGKMDAIGYAVCHRIDARSFHIGKRAIPVCARCSGQYLGAMLGLLYQGVISKRRAGWPSMWMLAVVIVFGLSYAVDGLNSYIHLIPGLERFYLYEPSNFNRIITGSGVGIGLSVLVFPAFRQSMLVKPEKEPVFNNWYSFLSLVGLTILMDLLILTENPLVLYPAALISAGGVIVLLTMVYSMVFVMLTNRENQSSKFSDMIFPLVVGVVASFTQVAALDLIRFLLTGTWDGFHIG